MKRIIEKIFDKFLLVIDKIIYNGYMAGGIREVITFAVVLFLFCLLGAGLIFGVVLLFR